MNLIPTSHKILVRMHELEQLTPEGKLTIVLPETVAKLNPYGEVLAVGPSCTFVQVGDKVLFQPQAVIGVRHKNEELFFVDEGSVFGKYVEDAR